MNRRSYLATVAAAGFAGCADGSGDPDPAMSSTPSTDATSTDHTPLSRTTVTAGDATDPVLAMGETFETADGRRLTVSRPKVRRLVVAPEQVSHHTYYRVQAPPDDSQYAVATAVIGGFGEETAIEDLPLSVALDGERRAGDAVRVGRSDSATSGKVGVVVPVTDAKGGALVWEREDGPSPRWRLPAGALADLAVAPQFEVRSVSVPDEVRNGESIPVEITVANTGDREGRFLASLDVKLGSLDLGERAMTVPAGGEVTRTVDVQPETFSVGGFRVVLDWGRERREWEVALIEGTETAG